MKNTNGYDFQPNSKHCLTCEDLHRLRVRSEAAFRDARNLCGAEVEAIDSVALQNLEEELKQTSAAHKLVCYAVQAHLTELHAQMRDVRLAA